MRRSVLLIPLVLAGCGGGADSGQTPTLAGTSSPALTVTTPENTAQAEPAPTGNPRFTVDLVGESNEAVVGRPWRYTVRLRPSGGGGSSGTAKMRVFVDGELVDTLGFFLVEGGTLRRTHRWPAVLKGKADVVLQAEVEGDGGTARDNFPVAVR